MNNNMGNGPKGNVIILRRGRKPNVHNMHNGHNIQNRLKKYKPNNQIAPDNTVKLRTRRNKQQIIAQNLSSLKENLRKKQLAQELYYQRTSTSRSPLIRANPNVTAANGDKPPVHNRLGRKNFQFQNKVFNNTVNRNNKVQNGVRQNRVQKVVQLNQVNKRMQKFRAPNNTNNYLANGTQKIILRRGRRPPQPQANSSINPLNYTVQVRNNAAIVSAPSAKHHTELNPRLQAEIKMIQRNNHIHEIVQAMPLHPLGSGTTKTTLNDRFSHL